ncbi:MAG: LLM class flavin-dependent oxidoreductase [Proteobacteria bacterium]|nr:LLM class flavin-dependent oxidoreductase [Pseudomonadota bacterium]MDA1330863.1 LLM class flavin-dependent oxidoreductase [Pseudomonadota bacterium]
MKLSILDQSPIIKGHSPNTAIKETVNLAKIADDLGFHRYWLAEHHNMRGLASACPEVLLTAIGQQTKRIRIGTGAVLLPYYSAVKVAETFRMQEALCPGRIDLGIGRAPGGDMLTAKAINESALYSINEFPNQVVDLIGWLRNELREDHPFNSVKAMPQGDTCPEVWLLGSSDYSSCLAAYLGVRFAFAHFINPFGGAAVSQQYRSTFSPSHLETQPTSMVCVFVICAESNEEAEHLAASIDHRRVMMATGKESEIMPSEEAAGWPYSEREKEIIQQERSRVILGTPENIRVQLSKIKNDFQADELMILTITGDYRTRVKSYELIAKEFDLQ